MAEGKIKHAFPGGNTTQGFFSFYEYILSQDDALRIMVLKGGPGVGKSTFMKKIGMKMVKQGYDVEFMHCSSDNNSLDGLVIPAARVALLDGTAPHVVDPKNPGAVDEIINLGQFWDEDKIRLNRESIMHDNKEVGRLFARAYRYLRAAGAVYEDIATIYGWAMDHGKVNTTAAQLVNELLSEAAVAPKEGKVRKLFASAMTPDGLKNYLESILTTGKVYKLEGLPGTGTEKILEKVMAAAVERGLCVEAYYCPFTPAKLEHLVIPALDLSFTTANRFHNARVDGAVHFDLNQYLDRQMLQTYADALEYDKYELEALLNRAISTIAGAKALHDRMETFYIPYMDFSAVQVCWDTTMERILRYAEENKLYNDGISSMVK